MPLDLNVMAQHFFLSQAADAADDRGDDGQYDGLDYKANDLAETETEEMTFLYK